MQSSQNYKESHFLVNPAHLDEQFEDIYVYLNGYLGVATMKIVKGIIRNIICA